MPTPRPTSSSVFGPPAVTSRRVLASPSAPADDAVAVHSGHFRGHLRRSVAAWVLGLIAGAVAPTLARAEPVPRPARVDPAPASARTERAGGDSSAAVGHQLAIAFARYRLPNGLTVILHEDHAQPLVVVHVGYHVGSRDEPAGRTGFAHLFEHLMFMGTASPAREVRRVDGARRSVEQRLDR